MSVDWNKFNKWANEGYVRNMARMMAEDDNGLDVSFNIVITKNPGKYSFCPDQILYPIGKINGMYHCVIASQVCVSDDSSDDGDEDY